MIKPDWDKFRAKFSENPQRNFEWLCYVLFCKEFNKTKGVSRYKNQSAIETDPLQAGDDIVGHQAKFYDDTLSKHKDELIAGLERAKKDYPNITKIILYSNQEWGQARGQEPQGKKDVEAKAKELGIELELRATSFFESPFVSIDNEIIARHFFTLDHGIFNLIAQQESHSENILNEIQTAIFFDGQDIKIDRTSNLEKIKTSPEQVLILSGVGGVGKTALIKDFYEEIKGKSPVYIFKANEFELRNINEFFTGYSLQNFLDIHKEEGNKIIVIDSAEKLLDLKNTDPFKEFLATLVKENWKIIFTTRDNYLEDLNYQFFEIYKIAPLNINIQRLEAKELVELSEKYKFVLPVDEKLLDLIRNPFYLSEYLKFYKADDQVNYIDFKSKLWNRTIIKSKPAREQCFLKIAFQRANEGQFFVNSDCDSEILNELKKDGILGYESPHGYFITHDIYEEWALEKIIEAEFAKKTDSKTFFESLGSSLPFRRAFRKWLSEQLSLENEDIKYFIEQTIQSNDIQSFWKDEMLVSVLLSDFSNVFFDFLKNELLKIPEKVVTQGISSKVIRSFTIDYKYEESLIHRIFFLLRIACKEPDDVLLRQLGLKGMGILKMKYLIMKPKGQGWESLIKFIFENFDEIGIRSMHFVISIIHDWTSKFKEGETTKYCGLISLKYYQWILKEDVYLSDEDTKKNLLETIVYSSSEIKDELEEIFKEIIKNKWKNHRDPYYDLSKLILSKMEGVPISKILPKYVIKIADLFWTYTPKEDHFYGRSGIDIGEHFDMEDDHLDTFPTSSYQTPIYWLLQSSLQETVDFILSFVNKTVEYFAKSEFAQYEVEEVEVFIDENNPIKQYLSGRLWCMYRGNQAAPHVLASMHMALERFFLEHGKNMDSKSLESWLIYLLKNSRSASISAVVTSIVLAYPEKTFNIAEILFKTKRFFLYDTSRLVLDVGQKATLLSLRAFGAGTNAKNQIHEQERLDASDEKHRKNSLENLFLNYQIFRTEGITEEDSRQRQEKLYVILDKYYKDLPEPSKQSEGDKTWRLYLARMDRRKMNIVSEKNEEGSLITFNPEIEPELKEYSEKSLEKSSAPMKYTALKMWAVYKIKNDEQYKIYKQYEDDPKLALKEVSEVIAKLKKSKKPKSFQYEHSEEEGFYLLNHSIPTEVCSLMIRDYFDQLSQKEKDLCAGVVLKVISLARNPYYQYEVTDNVQSAISVLPVLLENLPETRKEIKEFLFFSLFNNHSIDMAGTSFNAFSIVAMQRLWKTFPDDMQSVLTGYLIMRPKFDVLREKIRQENYQKNKYDSNENDIVKMFLKENKVSIQEMMDNKLSLSDLVDIENIDLEVLSTAFQIIPLKTENQDHKDIVKKIITAFAEKLTSKIREDKVDYATRHHFLEKLVYFILSCPKGEIKEYLKSFIDKFDSTEAVANLFKEFITAEDYLDSYENFWEVWNLFKEKIVKVCEKGDGYSYIDRVVRSYLFAQNSWKESAVEWHTFKDEDKRFFKEISEKLGHCPSALYSISKLLNNIGSPYLDDGMVWVSNMIKNNPDLPTSKLEVNTVYYLENLAKKYIYKNREKVKRNLVLKQNLLVILDFLVRKGSAVGYILRESIL